MIFNLFSISMKIFQQFEYKSLQLRLFPIILIIYSFCSFCLLCYPSNFIIFKFRIEYQQGMQVPNISRSHSSNRIKFKEIANYREGNQLNNKYELYKNGTPNQYTDDLNILKAQNVRNDVTSMQMPAIDHIINIFSAETKEKHINKRNYQLYPNMIKQPSGRYKEILSEKQEIKDFIIWFQNQYQGIEKNSCTNMKKFEDKQTLIAAGFTEMTGQVAKVSKNRCQILKMLWNRKNSEDQSIIQLLNNQFIKKQKGYLIEINNIHQQYQKQIQTLRNQNKNLVERSSKQNIISRNCMANIRLQRKKLKRMEYIMKKLYQSNLSVKKQNLNLIEENIKLLMNVKQIKEEEALILNYRKMQIHKQKDLLKEYKLKKLVKLTQDDEDMGNGVNIKNLQDKKEALFDYFIKRLSENPDEKVLIKEEYFIDDEEEDHVEIQQYFKNIINRPNIQVELINQINPSNLFKDKAVNTNIQTQIQPMIIPLTFQKGIQVQTFDNYYHQNSDKQSRQINHLNIKQKNNKYHIVNQSQELQVQKQSKKRMIKHRLSRKNSLCLLQLQSLGQITNKLYEKKTTQITNFNKNSQINSSITEDQDQNKESNLKVQQRFSEDSLQEDSLLQNISLNQTNIKNKALYAININTSMNMDRKSVQFNNLLNKIDQKCANKKQQQSQMRKIKKNSDLKIIKMQQETEQYLRFTQIEDLIKKHIMKNSEVKLVKNPQKPLNRILLSLFKNISIKNNINFVNQLLQVIKNSYGNMKTVIWKFLSLINIIRSHSNDNSLLKIISILLKVNQKYSVYDEINTEEIGNLYFKLFFYLTIRQVSDSSFNLWKASTTLQKIKHLDFIYILDEYFSTNKRKFIENKLQEIISFSQSQSKKKKGQNLQKEQQDKIIKLNPIILYIFQNYLIEKKLYHTSYLEMIEFLTEDQGISTQILIWMFDIIGFSQEKQHQILQFLFVNKKKQKKNKSEEYQIQRYITKHVNNDDFYRCCVKFDFPIYQELSIATFSQFKLLPESIQTNYYRMIGLEEWKQIKDSLLNKYKDTCESKIYFSAFQSILNKLQNHIQKGMSIYGLQQNKLKKKQQTFALFYKIVIIAAHKKFISKDHAFCS